MPRTSGPKDDSPLVSAARAVDDELRAFDELARTLLRAPLEGQKHLERAARLLEDLGGGEERLGAKLGALVQAITVAREQREQRMQQVRDRAGEVERRASEFQALLQRYGALGGRAAAMNERVAAAAESPEDLPALVEAIERELGELGAEAGTLGEAARAAGFLDLVKLAETMRSEVGTTRARLKKPARRTVH